MSEVASVARETVVKIYGDVWLVDPNNETIYQHLGPNKPSLFYGFVFNTLDEALAVYPSTFKQVLLPERVRLPRKTPACLSTKTQSNAYIPQDIYIFEFENFMQVGLNIVKAKINQVEFDSPPAQLMGRVDYVASSVLAGHASKYRVLVEYNDKCNIGIYDNPQISLDDGYYKTSKQRMAFFNEEEAEKEAETFAQGLIRAADWRSRKTA